MYIYVCVLRFACLVSTENEQGRRTAHTTCSRLRLRARAAVCTQKKNALRTLATLPQ